MFNFLLKFYDQDYIQIELDKKKSYNELVSMCLESINIPELTLSQNKFFKFLDIYFWQLNMLIYFVGIAFMKKNRQTC